MSEPPVLDPGATVEDRSREETTVGPGDGVDDSGRRRRTDYADQDGASDRERLAAFMGNLLALIDDIVKIGLLEPLEYADKYGRWRRDVQASYDLVQAQLAQPAVDDHLTVAGLTGVSLDLKLSGFNDALERYLSTGAHSTRFKAGSAASREMSQAPGARGHPHRQGRLELG